MTLISTQKSPIEEALKRYSADGGGFVAKPDKPNIMVADGDGFTTKPRIPQGLAADIFVCEGKECDDKTSNRKKLVSTAVLLAGGAVIGYCLKGPIGNCVKGLSDKFTKFFSEGKPAEYLQKAKDLVMSKK